MSRIQRPADRSLVSEAVSTLGRAFAPPDAAGAYLGRGGEAPRRYMLEPFDHAAEIGGSLETVAALEPADRRAAPAFAWSGDAQPFEAALAAARAAGATALGGGGGVYDSTVPTLSNLAPIGVEVGGERQIYAALSGDAAFTNFWNAPSHGFLRLSRTVEATESPRRLKPYELSYAAYSALSLGLRTAVRVQLDAVRTAPVAPIPASRYAAIAEGFSDAREIATGPLAWRIEGRGALETVRFDAAGGYQLDLGQSRGVTGARRKGGTLYIGLDAAADAPEVALRPLPVGQTAATGPGFALDNARWSVRDVARTRCSLRFEAQGFGPGEMTWQVPGPGPWRIEVADAGSGERIYWDQQPVRADGLLALTLPPVAAERPVRVGLSNC